MRSPARMTAIIAGLFLLFGAFGCTEPSSMPEDWETFQSGEVSISYPADWELDSSGQMGTRFVLYARPGSFSDQFRENINLLAQDLTGSEMSLDQYTELSLNQIRRMGTNVEWITDERLENAEIPCHHLVYQGDQAELRLQFEQFLWVVGDQAFVLTYTAQSEEFARYHPEAIRIMTSFQLVLPV